MSSEGNHQTQRRRRRSIIREFCLNTSAHGLPGIARSESVPNRIFWSISTLFFSGIMVFFVVQSIIEYFNYPSQTSLSVVLEWPVPFPAFTFCNYCRLRGDRFIEPFLNYINSRNVTPGSNATSFSPNFVPYIQEFLNMKISQNESLDEYYFSLDSMMISCTFNGANCSRSNFTSFESPFFGRCYTYNAKRKNLPNGGIKNSNDGGQFGILSLRLYIHSHQCIPYTVDATGVITYVHDNEQAPEVDISPSGLGPGQKHTLVFTKRLSYFLPEPYTNCTTQLPKDLEIAYSKFEGADYGYSQFNCYFPCAQAYIYEQCNCVHPYYWMYRTILPFGSDVPITPPFCSVFDPCYSARMNEFLSESSIWQVRCPHCVGECKVITLSVATTSMASPPDWLMDSIKDFVENSSIPLPQNWSTTWRSRVHSSYVAIDLIRGKNFVENLTQDASLNAINVIANVGGHSGLWIGISFLSLMEIVEMLYRLFRVQYNRIVPA